MYNELWNDKHCSVSVAQQCYPLEHNLWTDTGVQVSSHNEQQVFVPEDFNTTQKVLPVCRSVKCGTLKLNHSLAGGGER
jgi:hypothetical protein